LVALIFPVYHSCFAIAAANFFLSILEAFVNTEVHNIDATQAAQLSSSAHHFQSVFKLTYQSSSIQFNIALLVVFQESFASISHNQTLSHSSGVLNIICHCSSTLTFHNIFLANGLFLTLNGLLFLSGTFQVIHSLILILPYFQYCLIKLPSLL